MKGKMDSSCEHEISEEQADPGRRTIPVMPEAR